MLVVQACHLACSGTHTTVVSITLTSCKQDPFMYYPSIHVTMILLGQVCRQLCIWRGRLETAATQDKKPPNKLCFEIHRFQRRKHLWSPSCICRAPIDCPQSCTTDLGRGSTAFPGSFLSCVAPQRADTLLTHHTSPLSTLLNPMQTATAKRDFSSSQPASWSASQPCSPSQRCTISTQLAAQSQSATPRSPQPQPQPQPRFPRQHQSLPSTHAQR